MLLTVKFCLGIAFGVLCGASLLLNTLALFAVFRLAFVLRKNHVYIIAFFNILSDVIQMSLHVFYLTPSILTNSFLVSDEKKSKWTVIIGSLFMFLWYFETLTQIIMALNRFVIICLQKHNIFTLKTTLIIFSILIPSCFCIMYMSQYGNPCCTFLIDHEYLSYSYYLIDGVPNYSEYFDLPLNTASSVISGVCYVLIYWTVHKTTPAYSSTITDAQKSKRNRDIRYAAQFSMLLLFYVMTWTLFRVLFRVLVNRHVEWFILVPTLYTLNCTSNAIIYLGFNCEVQNMARPRCFRSILVTLGLLQTYELSPQPTQTTSFTINSRVGVEPVRAIAERFVPARRVQPFRSIGLNLENRQNS